jgi:hypothetical protein
VRRTTLIAALCAGIGLLAAAPAQAAFPGTNGKIAFANSTGIAVANPDQTGFQQLTTPPSGVFDNNPSWSADGMKIAFERDDFSSQTPTLHIFTINPDGGGLTGPLTSGDTDCQPAFLKDGSIAFIRASSAFSCVGDVWVRHTDGSETQLTSSGDAGNPTSSPDGGTVGYTRFIGPGNDQLFTVPSGGGEEKPLTTDHGGPGQLFDENADFAPGGSNAVFSRQSCSDGCSPMNLFTVPAGGGSGTALTNSVNPFTDVNYSDPAYSPDGTQIVFESVGGPEAGQPAGSGPAATGPRAAPAPGQLGLISSAGGASTAYLNGFAPNWQPLHPASGTAAAKCPDVGVTATSYTPKITLTPTVPGVRTWIYVKVPSRVQVIASLSWNAGKRSTALGTFVVHDTGKKKLRIPIPGKFRDELPIGSKVVLTMDVTATPDAPSDCIGSTQQHIVLHTRVVHILKQRG